MPNFKVYFYFICMKGLVSLHICAAHACSHCRSQKRATDALETESHTVVSSPVGAGNRTQVFCKSSRCHHPALECASKGDQRTLQPSSLAGLAGALEEGPL